MNGREFEKNIRKIGRRCGIAVSFDPDAAKAVMDASISATGSRRCKDRTKEIGPGLLAAMLAQLGLTKADLED